MPRKIILKDGHEVYSDTLEPISENERLNREVIKGTQGFFDSIRSGAKKLLSPSVKPSPEPTPFKGLNESESAKKAAGSLRKAFGG